MTLQPGQTIGRYQIIEPLGAGGMATVYKAHQPSLEREVALKVLRAGMADDPEFFQRFQREARSIAKLRHPHIVQVFDFEPLDGRYVLAMEFLEGGTLKERITSLAAKGERIAPAEVSRITGEIAEALSHAHELGIIHRDMKPSNVMLSSRDRAVVTDFGIAKIMGGEGQTQTGVGIGTPEYMAPEQGSGAQIDHRADIYSLGVMAYELLTGRVPFVADTPLAVVIAHVKDPLPPPRSIDPSVSVATERVLMKALAKDPKDRYASANDFADALKATLPAPAARTGTIVVPPSAVAQAGTFARIAALPRAALIGAGVAALVLIGAGAFALTRGGGTAPAVTPSGGGIPGPAVPHGALLYELDRSPAGESKVKVTGRDGAPSQARFLGDAVELEMPANSNVSLSGITGNFDDFVAQLRLTVGSGMPRIVFGMHSSSTGSTQVVLSPRSGEIGLQTSNPAGQVQDTLSPFAVRYAGGRTMLDLVVSVRGQQIVAYVDGAEVARGTDTRVARGGFSVNTSTGTAQPSTVSILTFRVYAQSGGAP